MTKRRPMQCRSKKSYIMLLNAMAAMIKYWGCNATLSKPYRCKFCHAFHLTKVKI